MVNSSSSNKRIAKNTILLYFRMMFLMVISLYTSRVILNALGVVDYGIYNVVGGTVALLTVLTGSLSAAISRYITFELGTGNHKQLNKIFSISLTIQLGLSLIIVLIAETVGLWFLNYKMVIPESRLIAANWCLQFSVISFMIGLLSVPYNALIIAHEKMSAFAYISLIEGVGKLLVAWLIVINPIDRLVYYAAMIALLSLILRIIYASYCQKHFEEAKYHFYYDTKLLRNMFSFAGWNFFGVASGRLMFQGLDLLSNLFFGVTVNAARGIATQIDAALQSFINNFTTAINPQITKSYAVKEMNYMYDLIFRGARLSYFFILFFAVPLLCETPMILSLWLNVVPDYTVNFARLTVIISMISVLSNTMVTAMLATGDIKKYQIIIGGVGMLVLPVSWGFFILDFPPEMAYVSVLFIFLVQWFLRLFLLREMIGMSIKDYLYDVVLRVMLVSFISLPIPVLISSLLSETIIRFLLVVGISVLLNTGSIYYIGLTKSERYFVVNQIKKVPSKLIKDRK